MVSQLSGTFVCAGSTVVATSVLVVGSPWELGVL
jgi:hypothetical protein